MEKYKIKLNETYDCFYITKDNVEEFVNTYGIETDYTIEYINNSIVKVNYEYCQWYIFLNRFYVNEQDGWMSYDKKDFDLKYTIIGKGNNE